MPLKKYLRSHRFETLYLPDPDEPVHLETNKLHKKREDAKQRKFQEALVPNPPSWEFWDTILSCPESGNLSIQRIYYCISD